MSRSARVNLKALGTFEIAEADGSVVGSVQSQPLRCAVFTYLAIESKSGYRSRDQVAAMFWPEADDTRSRRSLNQLLYSLRQDLGADLLEKRGEDQLRVNADVVECDVWAFLDAMAAGNVRGALELYRGPLLDGFFVSKVPDFERWLDTTRQRLVGIAGEGAWKLADAAAADGSARDAVRYARQGLSFSPYDEAAVQRLLRMLDGAGERAGAISEYRAFEARMMSDLDVTPSPETRALIEAIREREKPAQSVETTPLPVRTKATRDEPALIPVVAPPLRTRIRRSVVVLGGLLSILALVWAGSLYRRSAGPSVRLDPRRVAVMFFDDVNPGGNLGWLTRGMTRDLIHDLSAVDTLRVVPAGAVQTFRDSDLPLDSVARMLQVGTLVDGSVRIADGRLQVTVQLIDATSGYEVESRRFEQPWSELFTLQSEILFDINRFLRERIGHTHVALQRQRDVDDVEAWRLVQQGEELLESGVILGRRGAAVRAWEDLASADSLLKAATLIEPRWVEPVVLRARVARAQFLSLSLSEPVPGQAPGSAGMFEVARGRLLSGARHVDLARRLAPGNADALTLTEYFRFSQWFLAGQRPDAPELAQSETALRSLVAARPDQALAWLILSRIDRAQGDTLGADQAAQRAFDADPFLWEGRRAVADLLDQHVERGRFADADRLCRSARRPYQDDRQLAECHLMILGWSAVHRDSVSAAWRELQGIEDLGFPSLAISWTMRRMYVAAIAARSGLGDSAMEIIARAYAGRGTNRADSTRAALAEAWIHVLRNDPARARHVLDSLLVAEPGQRARVGSHPWFAKLRSDSSSASRTSGGGAVDR